MNAEEIAAIRQRVIAAAPEHHRSALAAAEMRVCLDKTVIPVLVIDSPDKWAGASDRLVSMILSTPGSNRRLRIPMHGLSMSQYEQIEQAVVVPEWDEEGQPPPEFKAAQQVALLDRVILIFEKATGQKIAGETAAEKREYLAKRNEADRDAITAFISRNLCNYDNRNAPIPMPLLRKYEDDVAVQGEELAEFKSFDDWQRATEMQHILRFQRYDDPYVMEFPLRSLSSETSNKIQEETREPIVPQAPERDALTGRFMRDRWQANKHDVQYIKQVRACAQRRTVKWLQSCLMFQIPGQDEKEQYDWLANRLAGDLMRVKSYIENDILGVEHRYDFF